MSEATAKKFRKSERQSEACKILNSHEHTMLFGGSRAGKTFIILRNIILRALKKESTHLIVRFRFNHVKRSIIYQTLPKVMAICFPQLINGVHYRMNKTDSILEIMTLDGKGKSQIWFGGIDDAIRIEQILGNEFSTIHANECSQISYDAITTLRTRLAENSGLDLRFYYDLNPCGKGHWTYKEFIEKIVPETKREPSTINSNWLLMNPIDNQANLPEVYLKTLQTLPKRKRQRFWEGLFLSDVEGALWTDKMISDAQGKKFGEITQTIVAVDPSISHHADSDECGIVVASKDDLGNAIVQEDLSGVMSTLTWAQTAVNAYHTYNANYIVAEKNQGGDLVKDALKAVDRHVPIKLVHASKGKFARAEPVAELYELEKVAHIDSFLDLEAQLTEYVPINSKKSPDRLDALVWAITFLLIKPKAPSRARSL